MVTFDQCIFSCEGKKPTFLLLLKMPHLRTTIQQLGYGGRCPHPSKFHVSLRADGSFRTSLAKIYPAPMNPALAGAGIQFATATFELGFNSEVTGDVAELQRMNFVPLTVVQPDYYQGCCVLHAPSKTDLQKSERKGKGLNVGYLCWLNVGLMLVIFYLCWFDVGSF